MYYSRRQTVEEKNNKRKTIGFVLLSIGFILFMFFYGIPLLVKLASLAYDFRKGSEPIRINDNTPPPPPRLDALPKAVNKDEITIQGSSEAGSIVVIDLNGITDEVVTDNDGRFSITIRVNKGQNFIKAYAKDNASNKSNDTITYNVNFDTEPPEIEVISPNNNDEFYGSLQKSLTIKGKTEPNTKVQVNDRLAIVNSEGSFNFTTQLSEGANDFIIKSTDQADNTTEIAFTVTYFP